MKVWLFLLAFHLFITAIHGKPRHQQQRPNPQQQPPRALNQGAPTDQHPPQTQSRQPPLISGDRKSQFPSAHLTTPKTPQAPQNGTTQRAPTTLARGSPYPIVAPAKVQEAFRTSEEHEKYTCRPGRAMVDLSWTMDPVVKTKRKYKVECANFTGSCVEKCVYDLSCTIKKYGENLYVRGILLIYYNETDKVQPYFVYLCCNTTQIPLRRCFQGMRAKESNTPMNFMMPHTFREANSTYSDGQRRFVKSGEEKLYLELCLHGLNNESKETCAYAAAGVATAASAGALLSNVGPVGGAVASAVASANTVVIRPSGTKSCYYYPQPEYVDITNQCCIRNDSDGIGCGYSGNGYCYGWILRGSRIGTITYSAEYNYRRVSRYCKQISCGGIHCYRNIDAIDVICNFYGVGAYRAAVAPRTPCRANVICKAC